MNLASNCRYLYTRKLNVRLFNCLNSPILLTYYYYCDVLLSQQMLLAIKHMAGNTFIFQQDNAPSHHARDTIKLLQWELPDFIGPNLCESKSPDLNPMDYKVWDVMQQRVYKCHMNSISELKQRLMMSGTVCIRRGHQRVEKVTESMFMKIGNILNIYCETVVWWCDLKVMDK